MCQFSFTGICVFRIVRAVPMLSVAHRFVGSPTVLSLFSAVQVAERGANERAERVRGEQRAGAARQAEVEDAAEQLRSQNHNQGVCVCVCVCVLPRANND